MNEFYCGSTFDNLVRYETFNAGERCGDRYRRSKSFTAREYQVTCDFGQKRVVRRDCSLQDDIDSGQFIS